MGPDGAKATPAAGEGGERIREEATVGVADARAFYRSIRGSLGAAAALLLWDVALSGSFVMSMIFCPIWILVSLLRSAIHRPGWRLAVVRVAIPVLTLLIVRANDTVQRGIAEANALRVVAACEAYHADSGRFPRKLADLVPRYLDSVPVARYCLGPSSVFWYTGGSIHESDYPLLVWQVVPPYYRKIYSFERRTWSYLD
jgi:hypothetical protein